MLKFIQWIRINSSFGNGVSSEMITFRMYTQAYSNISTVSVIYESITYCSHKSAERKLKTINATKTDKETIVHQLTLAFTRLIDSYWSFVIC